jgi:hypothetical protein
MKLFLLLLFALTLQAKLLISPFDAMKLHFGEDSTIEKKSLLLTSDETKTITKLAKVKLKTKIYKTFRASKDGKLLGYGILVLHKVRSKDTAILSIITPDGSLKTIEIVAFNEPMEYLPSKSWIEVLKNQTLSDSLTLGKDIPSITAATMSARAATNAARIALSIYAVKFKK